MEQAWQGPQDLRDEPRVRKDILGPVVDVIIWKKGWEGNTHLQRRIMVQVSGSKLPRATRLPGLRDAATGVLSILLMFRD